MKKRKAALSVLLILTMVLSTLPPVSVFAENSYTVSLSASSLEVNADETVKINLDISSQIETSFNAFYTKLKYDAERFVLDENASEVHGFFLENDSNSGSLTIKGYGTSIALENGAEMTLAFTARVAGSGKFSITKAQVDVAANAEKDAAIASVGESVSVSIVAEGSVAPADPVFSTADDQLFTNNNIITITSDEGASIYYTTDGSVPSVN